MTVEYNSDQKIPHPALWHVLYRSSTPFWEGVREGKLLLQKCKSCGSFLNPPRPMCPQCQSVEQQWVPSTGKGKVYSWVTYQESPHPAFKAPYSVTLIELEEGVRLVSNMLDVESDELRIGMPVEVMFDNVAEDLTLPKFKKVNSNSTFHSLGIIVD